jgi:hypothetical protein
MWLVEPLQQMRCVSCPAFGRKRANSPQSDDDTFLPTSTDSAPKASGEKLFAGASWSEKKMMLD